MKSREQPIIVVRRKRAGHGHHGGAWKVAYADFVTAMMAFFLVMWLASQDSRIRDAVAGYFQEPGLLPHQKSNSILATGNGGIDANGMPVVNRKFNSALEAEHEALVQAAGKIHRRLTGLPGFVQLRSQIEYAVTTEGLRIELVDHNGSSFFSSGSSVPTGDSVKILSIIATEIGTLTNDVVVEGHTDSRPYVTSEKYGNWDLSTDRANAARRVMLAQGLRPGQVSAVRGFADRELRVPADPLDPRNRRISIVVRSSTAVEVERAVRARQTSAEAVAAVAGGMKPETPQAATPSAPVAPAPALAPIAPSASH